MMVMLRIMKEKQLMMQQLYKNSYSQLWQTIRKESTLCKQPPVLTLYTKDPCPLCDEALESLGPLLDQVTLEKVDITAPGNELLWKSYRYDIPVFHFNGKYLMKHRADLEIFKKALSEHFHT